MNTIFLLAELFELHHLIKPIELYQDYTRGISWRRIYLRNNRMQDWEKGPFVCESAIEEFKKLVNELTSKNQYFFFLGS